MLALITLANKLLQHCLAIVKSDKPHDDIYIFVAKMDGGKLIKQNSHQ
jgi:hypothetical protein